MTGFWEVTLGGLIGSGVASAIVGALLIRRAHRIQREVEETFALRASRRTYSQQALFELFGPIKMQFLRTNRAFRRWRSRNDILEESVLRTGNLAVRDLLLAKGHLIPPELLDHAASLIEHYDAWLEKFDRERGDGKPDGPAFIFVGPDGYPFPHAAETAMIAEADRLQRELFGAGLTPG